MKWNQMPQAIQQDFISYGSQGTYVVEQIKHTTTNKFDAMYRGGGTNAYQMVSNGYSNANPSKFVNFYTLSRAEQQIVRANPSLYNLHYVRASRCCFTCELVCNKPTETWSYFTYKYTTGECLYKFGVSFTDPATVTQ
jgi:hypothetical protein